jgi:hypothetical protein
MRRRRGRKEEKKRKSSKVVACGALFGMGFVRFFLFITFFPEFVYGLSHAENDHLHFKIHLFSPFSAFTATPSLKLLDDTTL